jgi:hypothetical protein
MQDQVLAFLERERKKQKDAIDFSYLNEVNERMIIVLNTIVNLIISRKIELGIIVLEKECD